MKKSFRPEFRGILSALLGRLFGNPGDHLKQIYLLINNTSDYVPQVSFIERELIEDVIRGQSSITNGQQRLTTNYKAYINHEDFRNVVLDLIRGEFIIVQNAIKRHQIPVGVLLNKEDSFFFNYINN
jgi:hypothetical protein